MHLRSNAAVMLIPLSVVIYTSVVDSKVSMPFLYSTSAWQPGKSHKGHLCECSLQVL